MNAVDTEMEHGLDDSCEDFVEQKLHVTPVYGWGWSGNPEEPEVPAGFWNFIDKVGHYNVTITAGDIIETRGWPLPDGNNKSYIGFATIEGKEPHA